MERKGILIITSSYDRTVDYLEQKFPRTLLFRLNVDEFSQYRVSVGIEGFKISSSKYKISELDVLSIYYRKPTPENLEGVFSTEYHNFAHREVFALVEGIVESFQGRCLSKPSTMRLADNKIYQIRVARTAGFDIPSMEITNDSLTVKGLYGKGYATKPISIGTVTTGNKKEYVQTNLVDESFDTALLKYSPAYFQKFIGKKDFEVRLTVVGDSFFAAKVDASNNVDWRSSDSETKFSEMLLPIEVKNCCKTYMKIMKLDFGCFDFIVSAGHWYFLEMNANGQWAWLDQIFDRKISEQVIGYLVQ